MYKGSGAMRYRLTAITLAVGFLFAVISFAQQKAPSKIRKVSAPYTEPSSPEQMYTAYCASCHGQDGKGNGPAAPALKAPVTDLTQLSKNNHGQFPAARVNSVLAGTAELPAHGSADMPIWGPVFRDLSQGHQSIVQLRINNLSKYIESIQAK
jgi:mono/diheme cytochrome c family protein